MWHKDKDSPSLFFGCFRFGTSSCMWRQNALRIFSSRVFSLPGNQLSPMLWLQRASFKLITRTQPVLASIWPAVLLMDTNSVCKSDVQGVILLVGGVLSREDYIYVWGQPTPRRKAYSQKISKTTLEFCTPCGTPERHPWQIRSKKK